MSTLLQAVNAILRDEFKVHGTIRIEERHALSSCEPVVLQKRGLAVVLKLDAQPPAACERTDCPRTFSVGDRIFPLFVARPGVHSICDYIIFYQHREETGNPVYVFLCELKSGRIDGSRQQIENGRILAEHILRMAAHHQIDEVVREGPEIRYRGIIFAPRLPEPKSSSRRPKCPYEPYPDGMQDLLVVRCRAGGTRELHYFCA
ncbi:hypothetical protein WME75_35130 [Sorangium sp. So ce1014]|uniref:hypothetical protein n=1 Tax=Sorangium sp. So ce1014 TaxID=3133326 RepID=UPI003F5DE853